MKLLSTPVIYGLAGLLAAAVVWGGVQTVRLAAAERESAKFETALAQVARDEAVARQEFEASARLRERTHQADLNAIEDAYDDRIREAEQAGDRTADDLRAGNLRLLKQWRSCESAPAVSGADPSGQWVDGSTELQAASVGRIDRAVSACDAQVIGLQDVIRANVEATQP